MGNSVVKPVGSAAAIRGASASTRPQSRIVLSMAALLLGSGEPETGAGPEIHRCLPNVTATAMEMCLGRRLTTGRAAIGCSGYLMHLHEEDRRLAARVLAGDARAFEEFFASYFARLYRFA